MQKVEPFIVGDQVIPGFHNKTLKTLGRVFDCSLRDKCATEILPEIFNKSLKKIDHSPLTGFMKAWGLQFMLLPQILWDFMVYEFALSFVKKLEKNKIFFYVNGWGTTEVSLISLCIQKMFLVRCLLKV